MEDLRITSSWGERHVGPGRPTFIVAEMSGNHKQDFGRAIAIIDAAAAAGCDAIKLQTYTPDTLTLDCDREIFQVKNDVNEAWSGMNLHQLYQTAYTPWDWQPRLQEYAQKCGLLFFSTPFDLTAVDFLEGLRVPLYKVGSYEIGHIPLLKRIAQTGKPVILSRGLSSLEEISLALSTLRENGCSQIALLHCVSAYPCTAEQMHLRTIPDIIERFDVLSGLSDHSLSPVVPLLSMALGGCILEKHITLSRKDGGPDAKFSVEGDEFRQIVLQIREAEKALGAPSYVSDEREKKSTIFRQSIIISKDIQKGERFCQENLRIVRPGFGLAPRHFEEILSRRANQDLQRGEALQWSMVEESEVLGEAKN